MKNVTNLVFTLPYLARLEGSKAGVYIVEQKGLEMRKKSKARKEEKRKKIEDLTLQQVIFDLTLFKPMIYCFMALRKSPIL